jgi:LmbE family N-acetylglucosaminyl deacetylase
MKEKILIVAAHSDDETLGCGGSIAKHCANGDDVAVLFMTDGVGSRDSSGSAEATHRERACHRALEILGCSTFQSFDFPDNALDSVPLLSVAKKIEEFCSIWGLPSTVYTHHPHDLNIDHRIVHSATLVAFRPQPTGLGKPGTILSFEVPSSTRWFGSSPGFHPNFFNNISSHLEKKLLALDAYSEEMRPWPHARSLRAVEALAQMRGSTVGVDAAEAFVVERIII